MKKLLLALSAVALSASVTSAQTLALYEEFSGENCGPCAASNPALWTLLSSNPTKVILIKYQSPIPSAGPIYNAYKTITQARMSYYNVPFAPYGRLQGTNLGSGTSGSAGHIANLLQSDINSAAAATPPFNITVTHAWSANLDSVTANVTVKAPAAFAPAGANLKLRIAVIEHLQYATPPGTNGETEFHNVVREMVPDATGTQLPNSWTAAQTQNYTIKGKVPKFVDKANSECYLVVWVQNETDKAVYQAAKSTRVSPTFDAGTYVNTPASRLGCGPASISMGSTMTLKNTGTTTLTSAKVYYRTDATPWGGTPVSWTGSLAAGATTSVTIPSVTLAQGTHTIVDSIDLPNGQIDMNPANNTTAAKVLVINPAPVAVPITTTFETTGGFPAGYIAYDGANSGYNWVNGTGTNLAHNGSSYMPWYKVGSFPKGAIGYLIIPTPVVSGPVTLEFWQAFAQFSASNNDKLEVIYSNNCGSSWTTLWSAAGSSLATTSPKTTTNWLPSPSVGSSDWKLRSVSLNSLPTGSVLAFRMTADGGNNFFIDDINIRAGNVGVNNLIAANSLNVYPNPAKESATLEFTLGSSSKVNISVLDATGRTVSVVTDATLPQGAQRISIPTSSLAAGVYNITIRTEEGVVTERLSVVK